MNSYKHSLLCLFIHLLLLVLVFVSKARAQTQLNSSYLFRSVYSFGDSFVDPGNNNYIQTNSRSNFPPYGRDFVNHMPTGRFSNGRLFPDFLAYYFGVLKYQRPYLDPTLDLMEQPTAVSFASATSGYDPLTSNMSNAISMSKQLEYFKQYKAELIKKIGKQKADNQMKKAIFYVNAASDDFAFSYFGDGINETIRHQTYKLLDYEKFLLQLMQQFIQGLSDQGARKIAVTGLPPLGCIPIVITILPGNSQNASSPQRKCLDYLNSIVKDFNVLVQNELKSMQTKLSKFGTKIAYIDFEKPLLNVIQNPNKYGFTEVNKGCCGTGLSEIGLKCNQTSPVCDDASKYVFWDAAHPSEKTYDIIFGSNLPTISGLVRG